MTTPAPPHSLAVHERLHWRGNAPLDCPWCIGETTYAAQQLAYHRNPEPAYSDDGDPASGLLLAVFLVGTLLFTALAFLASTTGSAINGWTFWAVLWAIATASLLARKDTR